VRRDDLRHKGPAAIAVGLAAFSAAGSAAVLGTAAPPSGASPPPLAAEALLAKAVQDADGASWVHEVGHSNAPGHEFGAVDDIGTFEGRQMIRYNRAQAEVIQIGQEAYIRGNASAISDYFELTKNDPQQLANTWISVFPSDGSAWSAISAAVTLKSDFDQVSIPGALTEGRPVTVAGQRCIPIVGHTSEPQVGGVTVTLYVTDSKTPLPVEQKATSKAITTTTIWSRWGHAVALTAPAGAVPITSLGLS
jgi:hypothetical protein